MVQDANDYAAGRKITLVGNDQFSDFANSDPYGVIDAAMNGTLIYRPNTMAFGRVVWNVIKRHPKLIKAVKGGLTEDGAIRREQFADLFEIDPARLLIGEGWINTAKKGQAANLQQIWGKSIQ
ncbi:MAG: capsid protein, partial [Devosia sp.]|nr:capsid protein [Devosia sp.]